MGKLSCCPKNLSNLISNHIKTESPNIIGHEPFGNTKSDR